jgi:hypothetical protein
MAADATLVEGAFKVAQSLVPQDLSGFYKAQYEMRTQTMKDVNEFFKTKDDEAKAAMGVLTDKYDTIMSSLASSGRTGAEGEYDAIADQLERVTAEYNTAIKSKDKKTQHKLEGEASRIVQQIERLESGHTAIAEFLKNEEIDAEATGGANFKVLDMVWDPETAPDKIEHIWENGSLTYKVNTENPNYGQDGWVTIKADDLMQSIVPKAHASKTALLDFEKGYRVSGEKGKEYYQEDVIDEIISGVFKTKKDFAGMVNYKMKGRLSFKEALITDQTIWNALNSLDPTEIAKLEKGLVEDGRITAADFANGKNAATLIDALTNIHSENFNKDAAYNAAGAYFEKGVKGRYDEGKIWYNKEQERARLSKKDKKKDEYTITDFKKVYHDTPFGKVSGSALAGDAGRIKKIIADGGNEEWYLATSGNKYKLENDKWYIKEWDKNKKDYTKKYEASLQGVKDDLGIAAFDYLFFPGSATTATTETSTLLTNPKAKKEKVTQGTGSFDDPINWPFKGNPIKNKYYILKNGSFVVFNGVKYVPIESQ